MPRKKLIRSREHVYHITSRSNSKEWFYLPSAEVWKIFLELLETGVNEFGVEVHAFVLMNNHYHLMARTPGCDVDKFMHFFNKQMSRLINLSAARINHVFGRPYNWSLIDNRSYYFNAMKYLYQNPVRAGLCPRVEDYPYSSINRADIDFPVKPYLAELDFEWLNEVYEEKDQQRIRRGLRKSIFRPGCSGMM